MLQYQSAMKYLSKLSSIFRQNAFPVGLVSLLVVFFMISSMSALSNPFLRTADEALHLDYAWQVSQGGLPVFTEGAKYDTGLGYVPPVQWVWQHPPLFYALIAPVVGVASASTNPENVVMYARLANAVLGTVALASVVMFLYNSLPRISRRQSAILFGGMLVSTSSIFIAVSGSVYNDTVPFALSALSLGYTAFMIQQNKMSWKNFAVLTILLNLGMLSRSVFALTVAAVLATIVFSAYTQKNSSDRKTLLVYSVLAGLGAVLVSGWFYVRNYILSGNLLGRSPVGEYVPEIAKGRIKTSFFDQLTSYEFWQVVGSVINGGLRIITLSFLFVVLLWVVNKVVDGTRKHELKVDTQIAVMLSIFGVLQIASAAYYMSGGGGQHVRYLIPLLIPISYFFARYVASIRANSLYLVAGIGSFYILSGYLFVRSLAEQHLRAGESFLTTPMSEVLKRGLLENDISRTYLVSIMVATLLVSSVVAVVATYTLHRRQS